MPFLYSNSLTDEIVNLEMVRLAEDKYQFLDKRELLSRTFSLENPYSNVVSSYMFVGYPSGGETEDEKNLRIQN